MIPCPECFVAILEPHPEFHWWFKCPICGFCCLNTDSMKKEDKEKAAQNPYTKNIKKII